MSRYRKIESATWFDQGFQELSAPPPNAQTLWLYLLTGRRTTIFPGLVVATEAVLADDLRWPLDADLFSGMHRSSLRSAWRELADRGMAKADWRTGVIVLPKALVGSDDEPREASKPGGLNAFKNWFKSWPEIPDCPLKLEYLGHLRRFSVMIGKSYERAFANAFGKHLAKSINASRMHPHKEQDQEKDQDQEQEREEARTRERPVLVVVPGGSAALDPMGVGRLAEALWRRVSDARIEIAKKQGKEVLPFPIITPAHYPASFRELQSRVREEAQDSAICHRVIDSLIADAERTSSIDWLSEKAFTEGGWRTARGAVGDDGLVASRAGPIATRSRQHHQQQPSAVALQELDRLQREEKGTST